MTIDHADLNHIPFNRPYLGGQELEQIAEAHRAGQLAGDGGFTLRCQDWIEQRTGCARALLTHSCTAALEMCAILAGISPGDEVIMPSFTFVSAANAFVLRGAVPVFVDIRPDTLNIDETRIAQAVTPRTRAIVPMHYAGVGCSMEKILDIAARHDLSVIEDAAQGMLSSYQGRPLGTFGQLGTFSFHETKNIISGEGGALLVNDPAMVERAEIIREKGTNRAKFFRGQVDKYTWTDVGSSYLPGEIIAAFLWAQLQEAEEITRRRKAMWNRYHEAFEALEAEGRARRPDSDAHAAANGHIYYLLLDGLDDRTRFIEFMRAADIQCVFHYVPLHSSPAGLTAGRAHGELTVTNAVAEQLVRLPMWIGLEKEQDRVIDRVLAYFFQDSTGLG